MTKHQLKQYRDVFVRKTRRIRMATLATLSEEAPEAKARRLSRLLLPSHYAAFFDYYFGASAGAALGSSPCAPFHTAAYKELAMEKVINQFRIWFRGAAKSLQTNVGNAFALKCRGELKFMLVVGINELRAKLLLADLQAQFEANERIIQDFGQQVRYGDWADGMFETQDGCYFLAVGIKQPFRGLRRYGHRIDFAVIDDIEDLKTADNARIVRERADKITGDLKEAFSTEKQRLVICNNLLSTKGVMATLLDRLKNSPFTRVSRVNLLDAQGTSTWPARFTSSLVEKKQQDTTQRTFEREYMNNPVEHGCLFETSWIRFEPLPEVLTFQGCIGYWDLSYTKDGDYKAFALCGYAKEKIYVLDIFCRQCGVDDALTWYYKQLPMYREKYPTALFYYDATAAQEAFFTSYFQTHSARAGMQSWPLPHRNAHVAKHLRIEATLTGPLHHGQLIFDEQLKDLPDTKNAVEQLLAFEPHTRFPDDFPDALASAVQLSQKHFDKPFNKTASAPLRIGKRQPLRTF